VASARPPTTARPSGASCSPPSPRPLAIGSIPAIIASTVINNDRVTEALSRLYADELTFGGFAREMLYIGERDRLASGELGQALRAQERWGQLSYE
jgi:hypothetical protein